MTELKVVCNQCPIDDERFILRIEMKCSSFESTDAEQAIRNYLGNCMRKAMQSWCDEAVRRGVATHSIEVEIDGEDGLEEQPNKRY